MWFLLVLILAIGGLAFWMWKRPDPVTRDQNNVQSELWFEQLEAQLGYAEELVNSGTEADHERAYQIYTDLGQKYELPDAFINMAAMQLKGQVKSPDVQTAVAQLEKAYRMGSDVAAFRLGGIYDCADYGREDKEKAAYWYQHAIAKGNTDAQFQMAIKFMQGDGVEKDEARAMKILKNNAEQGNAASQYILGQHFCAEGPEQDFIAGHGYLHQAAENRHLDATLMLAEHYSRGIGVPVNSATALKYARNSVELGSTQFAYPYYLAVLRGLFDIEQQPVVVSQLEKMAEKKDSMALSLLGTASFNGWGVPCDKQRAFQFWSEAAHADDLIALCSIAALYFEGDVVDKNTQKAFGIYQHAHAIEAQMTSKMGLGICYLLGEGVAQDHNQAKELISDAAESYMGYKVETQADIYYALGLYYSSELIPVMNGIRTRQYLEYAYISGSEKAACKLAGNYLKGLGGLEQDDTQAFKWYEKGAERGDQECYARLGILYLSGQGTEQDYAQALHWLKRAEEHQDSLAINHLAEMYEKGWGVEKDLSYAVSMYEKAAAMNEPEACYQLGRLYLQGEGVVRNLAEARNWLDKARSLGYEKAEQLYQRLDEYF
jgi:TPR repeat protein